MNDEDHQLALLVKVADKCSFSTLHVGVSVAVVFALIGIFAVVHHPRCISNLFKSPDAVGGSILLNITRTLFACGAFMIVGPLLMILNKEIMQKLHFDFPYTLSGLALLALGVLLHSLAFCGVYKVRPEVRQHIAGRTWYRTVLPLAAAKAGGFAFGNAVYLYLGLGFIQMLKAVNPVIVVAVMIWLGLPTPKRSSRKAIYLIIIGTLIEVQGEMRFSLTGLIVMISSELFEAISLVLAQSFLHVRKFTVTETLYIISLPTCFLLFSIASVFEWSRMFREGKYKILAKHPWYFIGSCFLGSVINFVAMAVVQITSPLTLKILNTFRGICVVFVGMLLYGEYVSPGEAVGYGVALLGLSLYNYSQMQPNVSSDTTTPRGSTPRGSTPRGRK